MSTTLITKTSSVRNKELVWLALKENKITIPLRKFDFLCEFLEGIREYQLTPKLTYAIWLSTLIEILKTPKVMQNLETSLEIMQQIYFGDLLVEADLGEGINTHLAKADLI